MIDSIQVPEGVRLGNEKLVFVTDAAGAKLCLLVEREQKGEYLRVKITGGGCNGLSYKMKFVSEPKRGDILVRMAGAQILVDTKSALYLRGTVDQLRVGEPGVVAVLGRSVGLDEGQHVGHRGVG